MTVVVAAVEIGLLALIIGRVRLFMAGSWFMDCSHLPTIDIDLKNQCTGICISIYDHQVPTEKIR